MKSLSPSFSYLHVPFPLYIWESAQLIDILHKASPDRVEVDVAHRFQEVDVLLTQKMDLKRFWNVCSRSQRDEKTPHDCRNWHRLYPAKEVKVVRNQRPRITPRLQKSRMLQIQADKGEAVVLSTTNPWQHRTCGIIDFPAG